MAAPSMQDAPTRRPVGYVITPNAPLIIDDSGVNYGKLSAYHVGVSPFDGFTLSIAAFDDQDMKPDPFQALFEVLVTGRTYRLPLIGKGHVMGRFEAAEFHLTTPSNNQEFLFASRTVVENVKKSPTLIAKQNATMTADDREQAKMMEIATRQAKGIPRGKYLPKGEFMDTEVISEIYMQHVQNNLQPPGDVKIAFRTRVPADPALDKEHTVEIARKRLVQLFTDMLKHHDI